METTYRLRLGRKSVITQAFRWCIEKYLYRLSRAYLAQGRKQVVEYSFDLVSRHINLDGVYNIKELTTLIGWLQQVEPEIFAGEALDIGANIGNHALFFSEFFKKVIAFEPNNRTFRVLSLNKELVDNIECHELGLSDYDGEAQLLAPIGHLGCSAIVDTAGANIQKIRIRKLDSMADDLDKVRLVKIDVEGHEFQVLLGAKNVIAKHRPIILFEQHQSDFGEDGVSRVIELLRDYGYSNFATVMEYPRRNNLNRGIAQYLYMFLARLAFGSEMRVEIKSDVEPEYYPFLVAIPDDGYKAK